MAAADTPLLDMVVKRISEEVASVLKVDPSNVEEHLGEQWAPSTHCCNSVAAAK